MTDLNKSSDVVKWQAKYDLKHLLPLLKEVQDIPSRIEARSITLYDDEEREVLESALEGYAEALMVKAGYTEEQIQRKIHGQWYVNMTRKYGKAKKVASIKVKKS